MTKRDMDMMPLGWGSKRDIDITFNLAAFVLHMNEVISENGGYHYEWASHYRMTVYMWRKFRKGTYHPGLLVVLQMCFDFNINPYKFVEWTKRVEGHHFHREQFKPEKRPLIKFVKYVEESVKRHD